jgi:hypothetical protein
MRWFIEAFKRWRRWPYKEALVRAFGDEVIDANTFHELMARMDKV